MRALTHTCSYAIVWISNQAGNASAQTKFKNKMPLMCRGLADVPVRVFAAWGHDEYRKSSTGMWDAFVQHFNGGLAVGESGLRTAPRPEPPRSDTGALTCHRL